MPGRQSHGRPALGSGKSKKAGPKSNNHGKKRSQNAFAIAERDYPQKVKMQRHRFGDVEGDTKRKRTVPQQSQDDDEDEEHPASKKQRGLDSEDDSNAGSDSDGNEWRVGVVDSDDDSDLDSDEAFGSSDDEKFEGFAFGGSKNKPKAKSNARKPQKDLDLEEDEEMGDENEDSDDLGEDAVDLATALDMNMAADEEEEQQRKKKVKKQKQSQDFSSSSASESESSQYDSEEEDDESSGSSDLEDEDEEDGKQDFAGLSKLQNFVKSLSNTELQSKKVSQPGANHEYDNPAEFGIKTNKKLSINDILSSLTDAQLKSSLKMMSSESAPAKSGNGIPGKLDAPLAKRQQDRLDRAAAYEKSKETLGRWIETVKANRRAEHLVFPLPNQDSVATVNAKQLQPTSQGKPKNELEATIQDILQKSGLAESNDQEIEDQITKYEELQERKMPVEDVRARRAELRMARELLFREEIRAKRVKKIKSKAYRRVHRKEREKQELQEREALEAAGVDLSEEDREKNDRRRAEERMGAKHRESKWAKAMKKSGRTVWDDEAKAGMTDMAKRDDELRLRIEGRRVAAGSDEEISSSESENYESEEEGEAERKLNRQLDGLDEAPENPFRTSTATKGLSGLAGMAFMQRAEAAKKEANDAAIEEMRRELNGEGSSSEDEDEQVSRQTFGGRKGQDITVALPPKKGSEFEERAASSDEEGDQPDTRSHARPSGAEKVLGASKSRQETRRQKANLQAEPEVDVDFNPWLDNSTASKKKSKSGGADEILLDLEDTSPASAAAAPQKSSNQKAIPKQNKQSTNGTVDVNDDDYTSPSDSDPDSDSASDDDEKEEKSAKEAAAPLVLRNQDLVARAFAGDEVLREFNDDKDAIVEEEGDQVIDNTLPGWGDWTGTGVKKNQKRGKGRFVTKVAGVQAEKRKDAKLEKVIINEKTIKKVCLYCINPTKSWETV